MKKSNAFIQSTFAFLFTMTASSAFAGYGPDCLERAAKNACLTWISGKSDSSTLSDPKLQTTRVAVIPKSATRAELVVINVAYEGKTICQNVSSAGAYMGSDRPWSCSAFCFAADGVTESTDCVLK